MLIDLHISSELLGSAMTTIDDSLGEIRSVRNDIWRCRELLKSDLPDAEREIMEKRLLERRSTFERLLASTFPLALTLCSGETRGEAQNCKSSREE